MLEITGTHNTAKVFIDTIDETAREQIRTMCSRTIWRIPASASCPIPMRARAAPSAPP